MFKKNVYVIEKKNGNFIWEEDLTKYSEVVTLIVGYNCLALLVGGESNGRTDFRENESINIDRKKYKSEKLYAVSCESLDIAWGCSGVNTTNSPKPRYTLGMSGSLTLKVTNLNRFHRHFNGITTEGKEAVEQAIWNKLHGDISRAAESALRTVAASLGDNPDNDVLLGETRKKVQEVFSSYGLELLTITISGGLHVHQEETADSNVNGGYGMSAADRVRDVLNTDGGSNGGSEEAQCNREKVKLNSQHVCPRCGYMYTGTLKTCPNCGKDLTNN